MSTDTIPRRRRRPPSAPGGGPPLREMQDVLSTLIGMYWNELHAKAEWLARRHGLEADDVLNEAVARALEAAARLDGSSPDELRAWLERAMEEKAKQDYRRSRRTAHPQPADPHVIDRQAGDLPDPQEHAERAQEVRRLRRLIGELPFERRTALLLEGTGRLPAEMAAPLALPSAKAVSTAIYRGRQQLLESMETLEEGAGCRGVRRLLAPYIDGALPERQARKVERHLARGVCDCERARRVMELQRQTIRMLIPPALMLPTTAAAAGADAGLTDAGLHAVLSASRGAYVNEAAGVHQSVSWLSNLAALAERFWPALLVIGGAALAAAFRGRERRSARILAVLVGLLGIGFVALHFFPGAPPAATPTTAQAPADTALLSIDDSAAQSAARHPRTSLVSLATHPRRTAAKPNRKPAAVRPKTSPESVGTQTPAVRTQVTYGPASVATYDTKRPVSAPKAPRTLDDLMAPALERP